MKASAKAKITQEYTAKATLPVCGNCAHYRSEIATIQPAVSWGKAYTKETQQRCGIGGFAVKKAGTCLLYKRPA